MGLAMATTRLGHDAARIGHSHPWLGALLEPLDRQLRLRQGVSEYTTSTDCIFRMQLIVSCDDIVLSDNSRVIPGDRVVDLHLWNEHVPAMPKDGPTLAWARRTQHCIEISLRELARYLAERPGLDDIRAIRGNMSFGSSASSDRIARLAGRYGFERISAPQPASIGAWAHRFGENILVSMLALARNARSLRADTLWRDRTLTYLSRAVLDQRFGTRS